MKFRFTPVYSGGHDASSRLPLLEVALQVVVNASAELPQLLSRAIAACASDVSLRACARPRPNLMSPAPLPLFLR